MRPALRSKAEEGEQAEVQSRREQSASRSKREVPAFGLVVAVLVLALLLLLPYLMLVQRLRP